MTSQIVLGSFRDPVALARRQSRENAHGQIGFAFRFAQGPTAAIQNRFSACDKTLSATDPPEDRLRQSDAVSH